MNVLFTRAKNMFTTMSDAFKSSLKESTVDLVNKELKSQLISKRIELQSQTDKVQWEIQLMEFAMANADRALNELNERTESAKALEDIDLLDVLYEDHEKLTVIFDTCNIRIHRYNEEVVRLNEEYIAFEKYVFSNIR